MSTTYMKYFSGFAAILLFGCLSLQAQDKEFTIKYKNGKVYREGKFIFSTCGRVLQENTYDANGELTRQEQWQNNKRCGTTKVYRKNVLMKEIKFKNNLIESYTAYLNGTVYSQISEDRKIIINKGKQVNIKWKRFYTKVGKKLLIFTKNELIDALRRVMFPEEITQTIADISKDVDLTAIPDGNAALFCGGKSQAINDANADFKSTDPQKKREAADVAGMIGNTCSASAGANLTSPFDGKTGDAARKARIDKARSRLDNMIANCSSNSSNLTSGGMVSIGEFGSLAEALDFVIPVVTRWTVSATTDAAATAAFETVVDGAVVTVAEGTVAAGTAGGAGAIGGTVTAGTGGGAVLLAGFTLPEVLVVVAGVALVAGSVAVLTDDGTSGTSGGGSGESEGPGIETPRPDDMGSGNTCDRLKGLKKWCDMSGWQSPQCQAAASILSGCGGDVTRMYVTDDGTTGGINCPSSLSAAEIARKECERRGMFAMPAQGGSVCRSSGPLDASFPNPSTNIINPTRGDFSTVFENTSVKVVGSGAELVNSMKAAKKPTLVVFMNPDCSSCQNFSQSLKSKEVIDLKDIADIIVIDASASPEVIHDNNITAFPSYFMIKDGKRSTTTIGTMPGSELSGFIKNSLK